MPAQWRTLLFTILSAIGLVPQLAAAPWHHKTSQKVQVRFLATSTLIRGTWGRNEDTYLAELLLPQQNESVLVRLVDSYPNEWPPMAYDVLISQSGTALRVMRDTRCDLPFSTIVLRTAPGDPMAILPDRLGYYPPLERTPDQNALLPCYRTVRMSRSMF